MKLNRLMAALTFVAAGVGAASAVAAVDPALPSYQKTSGVSGNLSSVGSDSLANLMTLWAEEFKRSYPNVNIQIQAAGSSTAPPALTEELLGLIPGSTVHWMAEAGHMLPLEQPEAVAQVLRSLLSPAYQ